MTGPKPVGRRWIKGHQAVGWVTAWGPELQGPPDLLNFN
jgi:hypothetical protein